jgi:hypothetical protein
MLIDINWGLTNPYSPKHDHISDQTFRRAPDELVFHFFTESDKFAYNG